MLENSSLLHRESFFKIHSLAFPPEKLLKSPYLSKCKVPKMPSVQDAKFQKSNLKVDDKLNNNTIAACQAIGLIFFTKPIEYEGSKPLFSLGWYTFKSHVGVLYGAYQKNSACHPDKSRLFLCMCNQIDRINVWYIYLHLVDVYAKSVGKYTISMDPMGKWMEINERRMWIWSLSTTWAWISLVRCPSNVPWDVGGKTNMAIAILWYWESDLEPGMM